MNNSIETKDEFVDGEIIEVSYIGTSYRRKVFVAMVKGQAICWHNDDKKQLSSFRIFRKIRFGETVIDNRDIKTLDLCNSVLSYFNCKLRGDVSTNPSLNTLAVHAANLKEEIKDRNHQN